MTLRHRYRRAAEGGGARLQQAMEYRLKFGILGTLLDVMMVRREWNQGIEVFLSGLKKYAEDQVA